MKRKLKMLENQLGESKKRQVCRQEVPLLVRYAKKCTSPSRIRNEESYYYDEISDMVRSLKEPGEPYAIDMVGETGPMTKKCDIEKGDDNKDRRMWH